MKNSFLRDLRPARAWVERYPLGNGVLGTMEDGGLKTSTVLLNDAFLWSGYDGMKKWRPDGGKSLALARELFSEGKVKEAEDVIYKNICGEFAEGYMPLGEIKLSTNLPKKTKNYERVLSLSDAVHTVRASEKDWTYVETSFTSHPDACYVKERISSLPLDTVLTVDNLLRHEKIVSDDVVSVKGIAPSRVYPHYYSHPGGNIVYDDNKGLEFGFAVGIDTDGKIEKIADRLKIIGYKRLRLIVVSKVDKEVDENALSSRLESLNKRSTEDLKSAHVADYRELFDRTELTVNDIEESPSVTRKAIKRYERGYEDPSLVVTEFDFGRYLLISSSRPGSPATNLQGIWNDSVQPPWNTHHTVNINTEMNYWCAEICSLHECMLPLLDFTEKVAETGREVAEETFGMRGWCLSHNSDIWGTANPVGGESPSSPMSYAYFLGGGGWLCSTLYESALVFNDRDYYSRLFPLIRGAAEFYLDYLEEYDGYRVPFLSTSPENAYYKNGEKCYLDAYTTIEVAIVRDVFTAVVDLYNKLEFRQPDEVVEESKAALDKLPPYALGNDGRILEYSREYPETEKKHRHVSHLYGLYPSSQIDASTPELLEGARRVLETRGLFGTGWSLSWKLNLAARLLNGDYARTLLRHYNHLVKPDGVGRGGCYSSLLCAHPPFQIDGNFGLTSGIAELLKAVLEGRATMKELFPASFKKIRVRGIVGEGGKTLSGEITE